MEFALIKAGKVVNVIVADQEFINQLKTAPDAPQFNVAVRVDQLDADPNRQKPGPGWSYDGTRFTPPAEAAPAAVAPETAPVPEADTPEAPAVDEAGVPLSPNPEQPQPGDF